MLWGVFDAAGESSHNKGRAESAMRGRESFVQHGFQTRAHPAEVALAIKKNLSRSGTRRDLGSFALGAAAGAAGLYAGQRLYEKGTRKARAVHRLGRIKAKAHARRVGERVSAWGKRDPMRKKSAKFERCVKDVKRSGTAKNPWAVCHSALGKKAFARRDPASVKGLKRRGYAFWKHQPVLDRGHTDNLVYDDGRHRVWVSRMTIDDYDGDRQAWLADRLTVEENINGRWTRHNSRERRRHSRKRTYRDPARKRGDVRDLVRFVWRQVPEDYKLTSVDGRRGAWIMTPERSEYRGGLIDLEHMPRNLLLELARRHFGYRG
jgi:hypothetical protein